MTDCIFTSAGDWRQTWDWDPVYVVYYGDKTPPPHAWIHKGMKFPNLKWWLERAEHECEYLGVFDDDLVFDDIASLFLAARESGADIFAPTGGSHSYPSLAPQGIGLREVEFIEMGFPIFKVSFLREFMKVYDPRVQDWGVDIWYSHFCTGKMIVSDFHRIHNPPLRGNHKREVESNPNFTNFQSQWASQEHGLPQDPPASAFQRPVRHVWYVWLIGLMIYIVTRHGIRGTTPKSQ